MSIRTIAVGSVAAAAIAVAGISVVVAASTGDDNVITFEPAEG